MDETHGLSAVVANWRLALSTFEALNRAGTPTVGDRGASPAVGRAGIYASAFTGA